MFEARLPGSLLPQLLKVLIRHGRRFSALVAIVAVIPFGAAPLFAQTMVTDAHPGTAAGRSGPLYVVTSSISLVLTIVRSEPADAAENGKRQADIRQALVELFDSDEMSRRGLGQRWTDASPKEQQDIVVLFIDLPQAAYVNTIGNNSQWAVYDIAVDGVSLISNCRSQFTLMLKRMSFVQLPDRLRNREASVGPRQEAGR
jgi:ABC-type transporter MlaC component